MIDFSNIPNLLLNSPGSESEVYKIERTMSVQLPDVYRQLLMQTNGFSIGGGVAIYGTEDIEERNATWEVSEYAKGFVAVGDDGEGNVFLMLQSKEENRVFCVESGTMNPAHTSEDFIDFAQWIKSGCSKSNISHEAAQETCHIILQTLPANGLKDLIKIKNVLGIKISSADLLNGSKNTPFAIAREYPFGKAKNLVEKLGVIGKSLELQGRNEDVKI